MPKKSQQKNNVQSHLLTRFLGSNKMIRRLTAVVLLIATIVVVRAIYLAILAPVPSALDKDRVQFAAAKTRCHGLPVVILEQPGIIEPNNPSYFVVSPANPAYKGSVDEQSGALPGRINRVYGYYCSISEAKTAFAKATTSFVDGSPTDPTPLEDSSANYSP